MYDYGAEDNSMEQRERKQAIGFILAILFVIVIAAGSAFAIGQSQGREKGIQEGYAIGKESGRLEAQSLFEKRINMVRDVYDTTIAEQADKILAAEETIKSLKVGSLEDLMQVLIQRGRENGIEIEITYSKKFKE